MQIHFQKQRCTTDVFGKGKYNLKTKQSFPQCVADLIKLKFNIMEGRKSAVCA